MTKKTVKIPIITRVEGEGALDLEISDDEIQSLALRIYEPPRYFEKFLEGRSYNDVIDIVARICGICPIAYQMSASHAIEQAFDIHPDAWVRTMRRFIYCGEWIQNHALHIHLLAGPDFLGFNSAIEMAAKYPDEVKRGMRLQKLGHDILHLIGGRSVNPVGNCVSGFYRAPTVSEMKELLDSLKNSLQEAIDVARWVNTFNIPQYEQDITFVALKHEDEYPFNEGRIASNKGLNIDISEFENHFVEHQVPYSTAFHCLLNNEPYVVGPLARIALNFDRLPKEALNLAGEINLSPNSKTVFDSIKARAIELVFSIVEAINIAENYVYPKESRIADLKLRVGEGFGCTEAPRGICWHHYKMGDDGLVKYSRIVPPTSQNQAYIEKDLRLTLKEFGLQHNEQELRSIAEMVIRNYDPCISCSVHFLNLNVKKN